MCVRLGCDFSFWCWLTLFDVFLSCLIIRPMCPFLPSPFTSRFCFVCVFSFVRAAILSLLLLWSFFSHNAQINVAAEAAACAALANYARVRAGSIQPMINERARLLARLADYTWLRPCPSDANLVLCRVLEGRSARDIEQALRKQGILIRCYAGGSQKVMDNYIRISCGRPRDTDVLLAALDAMNGPSVPKRLTTTLISSALGSRAPRAILWDMDGVLADVSTSYRRAIVETAAHFGAVGMGPPGWVVSRRDE